MVVGLLCDGMVDEAEGSHRTWVDHPVHRNEVVGEDMNILAEVHDAVAVHRKGRNARERGSVDSTHFLPYSVGDVLVNTAVAPVPSIATLHYRTREAEAGDRRKSMPPLTNSVSMVDTMVHLPDILRYHHDCRSFLVPLMLASRSEKQAQIPLYRRSASPVYACVKGSCMGQWLHWCIHDEKNRVPRSLH